MFSIITQTDIQRRRAKSISMPETGSLSSSLRSIDSLYEKLMHYLQENEQLKKQIQINSEEYQSEITKMKEINLNLIEENTRLEKALHASDEFKAIQEAEIQKFKVSINEKTIQQTNITSQEIDQLRSLCIQYQTDLSNLKNELEEKNILVHSLSIQIKLKKEENDQLLEACNGMKANLKNNHQALDSLTTNVKDLIDECSQFRKDCTLSVNNIQDKFREQFKHVLTRRSQRECTESIQLSSLN